MSRKRNIRGGKGDGGDADGSCGLTIGEAYVKRVVSGLNVESSSDGIGLTQ